jgi:O-antigen/teichoic acid export membrane protein
LVRLNRLLLEDAYPREILRKPDVAWQWPWWMIAVTAALSLAVNPAWSLLDGCNQVAVVAKFRFWSALASFGANALALIAGAGIYASAIGAVFSLLISVGYLVVRWKPFLAQFLERPRHGRVSWAHEIWPFQWRIAVSWASGYFIFDIITPIAFYFCGAVEAGRLGMSLQLVRMISNVAMTWVYTKAPRFGMLIAARAWQELDSLWRRSALQSFVFCLLGMGSFLAAISLIGHLSFLTAIPFIGQLLPMELRAHKREPYMWLSVANAVLSVVFILPLVRVWGIYGEAMGYALAIWAVLLPAYKIYRVKRLEYRRNADGLHEPPSPALATGPEFSQP